MAKLSDLKERARDFERQEEYGRALQVYQHLIKHLENTPHIARELALYVKAGDLSLKLGDEAAAVEAYERAAGHYAGAGSARSVNALCAKVLRVAPEKADLYLEAARRMLAKEHVEPAGEVLRAYAQYASLEQTVDALEELAGREASEARPMVEKLLEAAAAGGRWQIEDAAKQVSSELLQLPEADEPMATQELSADPEPVERLTPTEEVPLPPPPEPLAVDQGEAENQVAAEEEIELVEATETVGSPLDALTPLEPVPPAVLSDTVETQGMPMLERASEERPDGPVEPEPVSAWAGRVETQSFKPASDDNHSRDEPPSGRAVPPPREPAPQATAPRLASSMGQARRPVLGGPTLQKKRPRKKSNALLSVAMVATIGIVSGVTLVMSGVIPLGGSEPTVEPITTVAAPDPAPAPASQAVIDSAARASLAASAAALDDSLAMIGAALDSSGIDSAAMLATLDSVVTESLPDTTPVIPTSALPPPATVAIQPEPSVAEPPVNPPAAVDDTSRGPVVFVDGLEVDQVADFSSPDGRTGYQVRQSVGPDQTLTLTILPPEGNPADSVAAGPIWVSSSSNDSSIGTVRFLGFMVSASAPVTTDSLEALLENLVHRQP